MPPIVTAVFVGVWRVVDRANEQHAKQEQQDHEDDHTAREPQRPSRYVTHYLERMLQERTGL